MLQADLKLVNDVKKTSSKVDMFATDVKVSKRLSEYDRKLLSIQQDAKPPSLIFQRNTQVTGMLMDINTLGTLISDEIKSEQTKQFLFSDLNVERTSQIIVRMSEDEHTPDITGCAFMPDGQVVLCDKSNDKLKLLNKSFCVQGSLTLPSWPWDISVVKDRRAIITLPDLEQLHYITVESGLKRGRVLQLDKICWGVEVVGDDIFVTCHKGAGPYGGQGEVRILDHNGNVRKQFGLKQDGPSMFMFPDYLTVSQRTNMIYVSDSGKDAVTCLKTDGTIVYQYKSHHLVWPRGVLVDDKDNVIICGSDSNNILIVNDAGKKKRILLSSDDGLKAPHSAAYRGTDGTLIVGFRAHKRFFILVPRGFSEMKNKYNAI